MKIFNPFIENHQNLEDRSKDKTKHYWDVVIANRKVGYSGALQKFP